METPPPLDTPPLNSDDRLWAIFCHLSLLIGVGIFLPLIVYLVKKQDSPGTAEHAKEALNFHISLAIYFLVAIVLTFVFIGALLIPVLIIGGLVCSIIAAVKASKGELYRYPLTLRLVK